MIAADGIGYGLVLDGYQNTVGGSTSKIPPKSDGTTSYCDRGSTCVSGTMTPCTAGKYCEDIALTAVSGDCYQGYYCNAGAKTKTPTDLTTMNGDKCPAAAYCPAGTVTPTLCPIGTFTTGTGLFALTDCNACPAGYACPALGTIGSTLVQCNSGLYCSGSISDPSTGTPCPAGSYCPIGSNSPIPCPAGYVSTLIGQSTCSACAAGVYCPYQTTVGLVPDDGYIANVGVMPS